VDTGTAYLQHLTDADLALLAEPASAAAALRTEPTLLDAVLRSTRSFERVFGATESATIADVSPFLVFAVAVHRALDDLGDTRFVDERVGPRMRVPVFDAPQLAEFATDPTRRYFVVEHLASYTRVISGPVWVQRNNRWSKQRFSELDAPRLAQMVRSVPESDRTGLYRRLGDLALFLTGVFPDHTSRRQLGPVELERLLRSLPPGEAGRASLADVADLAGDRGATGVFEWLGPRWYALAAARTPLAALSHTLGEISQRFDQARRFLNHLTDRYLFPVRGRWFPAPGT
jgi:hypothetical protein